MQFDDETPMFSVCIPTYNSAAHIGQAIESVLVQSYGNFELLIQDDGSRDATEEIVENYEDDRISFERNEENLGIFGNLNALCERASGQYIKVLCADDLLARHCLNTIRLVVRDHDEPPKLIAVRESSHQFPFDKRPVLNELHMFTINRSNLFRFLCEKRNWGGGLAELCVEREFFEQRGFFGHYDKHKDFSKDIITWFEMVMKTDALMLNEPLVYQRPHSGQARYKLPRFNQLVEMFEFFYGREREFYDCNDFYIGRKQYLERYIASHYWYGLKRLFTGRGGFYLKQLSALLDQYNHDQVAMNLFFRKVLEKVNPIRM